MNDKELFAEIDEASDMLRKAALDLHNVFQKRIDEPTGAVRSLCQALKKLQTIEIERMDENILEINEKAQLATMALNKQSINTSINPAAVDTELFYELVKKSDAFTSELIKFSKMANTLYANQNKH